MNFRWVNINEKKLDRKPRKNTREIKYSESLNFFVLSSEQKKKKRQWTMFLQNKLIFRRRRWVRYENIQRKTIFGRFRLCWRDFFCFAPLALFHSAFARSHIATAYENVRAMSKSIFDSENSTRFGHFWVNGRFAWREILPNTISRLCKVPSLSIMKRRNVKHENFCFHSKFSKRKRNIQLTLEFHVFNDACACGPKSSKQVAPLTLRIFCLYRVCRKRIKK